jgi:hypothetical protein
MGLRFYRRVRVLPGACGLAARYEFGESRQQDRNARRAAAV